MSGASQRDYASRRSSRKSLHSLHSHELIMEDDGGQAAREENPLPGEQEQTPKQILEQNLKEEEDGVVMLQGEQEAIQESIFNFQHEDFDCLETSHNSNPGPEEELGEPAELPQSEVEPSRELSEAGSPGRPRQVELDFTEKTPPRTYESRAETEEEAPLPSPTIP